MIDLSSAEFVLRVIMVNLDNIINITYTIKEISSRWYRAQLSRNKEPLCGDRAVLTGPSLFADIVYGIL